MQNRSASRKSEALAGLSCFLLLACTPTDRSYACGPTVASSRRVDDTASVTATITPDDQQAHNEDPASATNESLNASTNDDAPATQFATTQPALTPVSSWYRPSKAASANRIREPVDYAHPLSRWNQDGVSLPSWVLFGMEQRTRFDLFDDSYLYDFERNHAFLMRSRAYLGIREIIDPLRFGVEFQDSRSFDSIVQDVTTERNENDFLQAFAELYFKDLLGPGQPLSLQAGRLAIDYVDRRLRTRNGFRNTTNAFDGFRLHLGDMDSRWEMEVFAVQPVEIRPRQLDRPDETRWFYGLVGAWRGWMPVVTLEPYYFILDEDRQGWKARDTELHVLGMRAYGDLFKSGFDYDVSGTYQCGKSRGITEQSVATHVELGYTIDHPWEPRIAAWLNYASGDRNPTDDVAGRFDRLFGTSNGLYGYTDYFTFQNLIQPCLELRLEPDEATQFSAIYRTNWLASSKDAWVRGNRIDPTGQSGRFIGQQIDLLLRHRVTQFFSIEVGYSHFMPGAFVRNTGDSPDSDRFFIQTILRL